MPVITNDSELRNAIDALSFDQQQALGIRFAESVADLTTDARLKRALETALAPGADAADRTEAYRTAKAISIATYTVCGHDTNWAEQAEHFVAATLTAALAPADQFAGKGNPAWKAAMQARMARNCAMIETGEGMADTESQRQYRRASA
jgi:hypothetical protein